MEAQCLNLIRWNPRKALSTNFQKFNGYSEKHC